MIPTFGQVILRFTHNNQIIILANVPLEIIQRKFKEPKQRQQ